MKNHIRVDGKLLQTNKSFSQLKEKQKIKINEWLYKEFESLWNKNGKEPSKKQKDEIVFLVYDKIEAAEIWLPLGELYRYYEEHKNKFQKRYEKNKTENEENKTS